MSNVVITSPNPALYVANSVIHGRGVFSKKTIQEGVIIEACPVIKMKLVELSSRKDMVLSYYPFMIDDGNEYGGLALGYGSLYNHSENCNAEYYYDDKQELLIFEAKRKIIKHEEITIHYLGSNTAEITIDQWLRKTEI